MLRNWIRDWLGLTTMQTTLRDLNDEVYKLRDDITLPLSDIAAILRDESDPRRKKLSDRLGDKVRQRLSAEDLARRHTTGEI